MRPRRGVWPRRSEQHRLQLLLESSLLDSPLVSRLVRRSAKSLAKLVQSEQKKLLSKVLLSCGKLAQRSKPNKATR